MPDISIPYGTGHVNCFIPENRFAGVLQAKPQPSMTLTWQRQVVRQALSHPIGSPCLSDLSRGKQHILIITSDHTRPMPSQITMPLLLEEIRRGNPQAEIHILVATGFHRLTTDKELRDRFGADILSHETVLVHNARDAQSMRCFGTLPSGGALWLNEQVEWADLILSEGFIEPHFFAGYSGGRKSILPGIASQETVFYNHNAEFIHHPLAHSGSLKGNPLHEDMLYAARQAHLQFILNVCLNEKKQIVRAFAGHFEQAHEAGCAYVQSQTQVPACQADIVITGNGGAPLDLNIYQSVKCMSGAEPCVRPGGVIIALCSCYDGHGSQGFYELFRQYQSPSALTQALLQKGRGQTQADQWQAQILARILQKAHVILVTDQCEPELVETFGLRHAACLSKALEMADALTGPQSRILCMPNGVELIAQQ